MFTSAWRFINNMLVYLLVFSLAVTVDILYVVWINSVAAKRTYLAAFAATGISACGVVNVINVIDNHWLVIPYLLGAFVGVLLGCKINLQV